MKLSRLSAAFPLALLVVGTPAFAQRYYDSPPAGFQDDSGDRGAPVDTPDPAGLAVRVGKLEGRIREMTGQIEELQNANRKFIEQFTKFQADVDTRLSSGTPARVKRSDASPVAGENGPAMDAEPAIRKRRDDAFDPDKAASNDPGKPKPLGSTPPGPPSDSANAPMDLAGGKMRRESSGADTTTPALRLPSASTTPPVVTPNATVIANTSPTAVPQSEFDVALGYYKEKQYESAEKGFSAFIEKNPKSKRVADATYYLGESYAQRGRSREAAEQYLKISTDFATSPRAPDAMLHLGMSLKALGAKEQACATFSEIARKYPNAPTYVRSGAEREAKRAQCAG